ncbi:hypothetical protein MauCBS54593_005300 [Microsporum audouinii]
MVLPKFFKSPKPVDKKKHKASPSASSIAEQTADAPSSSPSLPRRKTDTVERRKSTSLDKPPAYRRETTEFSDPFGPPPASPTAAANTSASAQSSPTKAPHRRPSSRPQPSASSPSSPSSRSSRAAPRSSSGTPAAAAAASRSRREQSPAIPGAPASNTASTAKSSGLRAKPSKKGSGGRFALDPNSHPLNLPPDELRRLSANMAAAAAAAAERDETLRSSMDLDRDGPSSPTPTPFSATGTTPLKPEPNGTGSHPQDTERSPTPPPHTSPPPPPVDPEMHKLAGNKFFKAGEYYRAIQEYTKAVDASPSSSTYLSNRAAAYISANRYSEALDDAKRADELEPGNPKIMHRLARIYTALGRPAEALQVYSNIRPPASAKDTAAAEAMLRNVTQAEETLRGEKGGSMVLFCLDQAVRGLGNGAQQPRNWLLMRVEAFLMMGNVNALGEAQNIAMSLLRDNNQDPDAIFLRGRLFYLQGDNDQAVKHFKRALSLDPDSSKIIKCLRMVQKLLRIKDEGNAAFKSRKYREAIDLYTRGLEVDPSNKDINSKLLQNRAQAHININQFEKAIDDCTKALECDPTYLKARRVRAKAYGGAGNWDEAVKELKDIAENHPGEKGIQEEIRNAEWELKKSQRKDYYKILGVEKTATETEIKKAYRKLAIQHHPDKNVNGDSSDDTLFKEIGEAYETLSDPQKRQSYDNGEDLIDPSNPFAHGGFGMGGMGGMGGQNIHIDPSVLFNMMNNGGGGFQSAGGNPFHTHGW